MTAARQIHNLALIGFMGTGKSSVGRLAADLLRFTYLDTDQVIQARAGKTIAEFRDFKAKKQAEEAVAVAKAPHVLHEERHIALGQEDSVRRPSILIP